MALFLRGACIDHLPDPAGLIARAEALLTLASDTLPVVPPARVPSFSVSLPTDREAGVLHGPASAVTPILAVRAGGGAVSALPTPHPRARPPRYTLSMGVARAPGSPPCPPLAHVPTTPRMPTAPRLPSRPRR